jgi:protein-tyrosine phosphatase
LLLALVGVAPERIAEDYELSTDRLPPLPARSGVHTQVWSPREALARRNTSARAVILAMLAAVDVEASLRAAGLKDQELATLRTRLLGPPDATGLAT